MILAAIAVWMWLSFFLSSPALAFDVAVVPRDGEVRAGDTAWVLVAAQDDAGNALDTPPTVVSQDATVRYLRPTTYPGVWLYSVAPYAGREVVGLQVEHDGRSRQQRLVVSSGMRNHWMLPERVVSSVDEPTVSFRVVGDDLPPPDALEVVSERARLTAVEEDGDGLLVTLTPHVGQDESAEAIIVAVRDRRVSDPPAWLVLWRKGWLKVSMDLFQPDVKVWMTLGTRTYGPVVSGADNRALLVAEQLPGESRAELRIVDPAGNESVETQRLATFPPLLLAVAVGEFVAGEPPPEVYVRATRTSGRVWRGEPPVCRAPRFGELPMVAVQPGTWRVQLPDVLASQAWELRVRCELADQVSSTVVVPSARDVVTDMQFRVYPEELTADFPVADVQVGLLNTVGERVPIGDKSGRFEVGAVFGAVDQVGSDGPVLRGEYNGSLATELGEDILEARWYAPPGTGPVAAMQLHLDPVPSEGELGVWVRVLDRLRHPLEGRTVRVSVGAASLAVVSGQDGWTRALLPLAPGETPITVRAESGEVVTAMPAIRGTAGQPRKRGDPDLVRRITLPIDTGRIAEVDLDVTPTRLRPEKRQTAIVRARFVDRDGQTAISARPVLTTSEGELRPLEPGEDGAMRWTLVPKPGFRARTITVTARSDVLDVEEDVEVTVRPKPVDLALGLSAGLHTNFSTVVSPFMSLYADIRIRVGRDPNAPLGPSRFFVRAGLSWFRARANVQVGTETQAAIDTNILPLSFTFLLRQEYSSQSFWVGLGGDLAPYWGRTSFDGVAQPVKVGVLAPGLSGAIGYSVRVPGGELAFELRGSTLTSVGSEGAVAGFVGGVAVVAGYRVVF